MKCYICDHTPPPTAIRYDVPEAIGICQDCGIGVCASHSYKDTQPGSPLLCIQCAGLRGISISGPSDGSSKRVKASLRLKSLPIRQPVLGTPAMQKPG